MTTLCATLIASTAFLGAPGAHAQDQASPGACLAVQDTLNVPVLVMVESTTGISPNGDMTEIQAHQTGYQDYPWIIQPGGAQTLIFSSALTVCQSRCSSRATSWMKALRQCRPT